MQSSTTQQQQNQTSQYFKIKDTLITQLDTFTSQEQLPVQAYKEKYTSPPNTGLEIKQKMIQSDDQICLNLEIHQNGKVITLSNYFTFSSINDCLQLQINEIEQRRPSLYRNPQQNQIKTQQQSNQPTIQSQSLLQQQIAQYQKSCLSPQTQMEKYESDQKSNTNLSSTKALDYECTSNNDDLDYFQLDSHNNGLSNIRKGSQQSLSSQNSDTMPNSPNISSLSLNEHMGTPQFRPIALGNGHNYYPNKNSEFQISNFAKKNRAQHDNELMKADKKNIVKNVVKGFKGYLIKWGDEEELIRITDVENAQDLNAFRKNFDYYLKKKKYNNQFILDLFRHKKYSEVFKYFLMYQSQNWLESSQVQDKASHEILLNLYRKSCDDESQLEKLKVLKTGQKKKISSFAY